MSEMVAPCIGIAGLGLIGGSLALAVKASGYAETVIAYDSHGESLDKGLSAGVVDAVTSDFSDLLARVDILVLAVPTQAAGPLLDVALREPGRVRVVTDVASVKAPLCAVAANFDPEYAKRFVAGHPIAGSERSGVEAADASLFRDHRVILTPTAEADDAAVEDVAALWTSLGAQVSFMSADEHDRVLAATSHLPHMLAYALVDTLAASPTKEDIFRYAAGGFRDFSRIASSDPVMWRDVALGNREALLEVISDFEKHLNSLRTFIDAGDGEALHALFSDAKAVRDDFSRDLEQGSRRR